MQVESFLTDEDEYAMRAFYAEALPRTGWRVELLPWQEAHVNTIRRMEQQLRRNPNAPEAARLQARVEQLQATQHELLGAQLYALRADEHLLINFMPADLGTVVFLNRWHGRPIWERGASDHRRWDPPGASAAGGLLAETADHTPERLPLSVPAYPEARPVAQDTPGMADQLVWRWTTSDALDEVAAYYRQQMPRRGWKLLGGQGSVLSGTEGEHILRFQKPGRLCVVALKPGAALEQAEQTNITVAVQPTTSGRRSGWR
jgi:hypothetical protein